MLPAPLKILTFLFCVGFAASQFTINQGPNIGILTLPSVYPAYPPQNYSFFPASYAKWLESAGAQVVPVRYDLPLSNLTDLLGKLNGILFTGGNTNLFNPNNTDDQFALTMSAIINYTLNESANGGFFPLWATCQGFEYVTLFISQNNSILIQVTGGNDISKPIYFYPNAAESPIIADMPAEIFTNAQIQNLTYFDHNYTTDPAAWETNEYLMGNFTRLAYTDDASNGTYVAMIVGKNVPIFATQFHPEKTMFEWPLTAHITHLPDAIYLSQYLANWFVNQTRGNNNTMKDIEDTVIYHYPTYHFPGSSFMEVYFVQNVNWTNATTEIRV